MEKHGIIYITLILILVLVTKYVAGVTCEFCTKEFIHLSKHTLEKGRMNIALDNLITFIIKICQKYLLVSESYMYSVFLEDSDDIFYLYVCYIFKKKIAKKSLE